MKEVSLEGLIETKVWRIFKTFLGHPQKIFHLNSVAQAAKVPVSSAQRIVKNLAKHGFVEAIPVGKLNLYRLSESEKVKKLKEVVHG